MRRALIVHSTQCSGLVRAAVIDLRNLTRPADLRESFVTEDAGKRSALIGKRLALNQHRRIVLARHQWRQDER